MSLLFKYINDPPILLFPCLFSSKIHVYGLWNVQVQCRQQPLESLREEMLGKKMKTATQIYK